MLPWVYITKIIMAAASALLNSCVIIFSFLFLKKKDKTIYSILHLLFIAEIHSVSFCINWEKPNNNSNKLSNLCKLQSFLLNFSSLAEGSAIMIILYYTYRNLWINERKKCSKVKNFFKKALQALIFMVIAYLLPLTFSLLAFYFHLFGDSTNYCWVKEDKIFSTYSIILFWGPAILNILISFFFIFRIVLNQENAKEGKLILKVIVFPIIEIFSLISSLINSAFFFENKKIYNAIDLSKQIPSLLFPLVFCLISDDTKFLCFERCKHKKEDPKLVEYYKIMSFAEIEGPEENYNILD